MRILIFFGLTWLTVAQAKTVYLFDFDGTLVNDRGPTASWITPWVMKRIDKLHTVLQSSPKKPIPVELKDPAQIAYVNERFGLGHDPGKPLRWDLELPEALQISSEEFMKFQQLWGTREGMLRSLEPVLLNPDPLHPERERLILPGYFRLFDLTFLFYRSSQENHLLKFYKEAVERAKAWGPPYTWKGRAFELFAEAMARPETVQDVTVFTAGGQDPGDFYALFDQWKADGHIRNSTGIGGRRPTVLPLSSPESRVFGEELTEQKVTVLRQRFESLVRSAGEPHLIEGSGALAQAGHLLVTAEDIPGIFEALRQKELSLSGGRGADQVAMLLANCGSEEEVERAGKPRALLITKERSEQAVSAERVMSLVRPRRMSISCNQVNEVI
ncbi:MAG: hypothetical protein C5B49_02180 [Bdellovibrio sp.]|nr:MAG: hypothetical protein C5B49_02180 [Bdellovibrio sp.]